MVTPALFAALPDAADLAAADPADVEEIIRSTGFYQNKTKSLIGMAKALVERFGGEVPTALEDLVTLPGRRAQDRQRRAQRGLPAARACRSTPTSGGSSRRLGLTDAGRSGEGRARAQQLPAARPSGATSACA